MAQNSVNDLGFYAQATRTLGAMVTPYGQQALAYANGSSLGSGAKQAYLGQVAAAQINGSGPAANPINAPWTFTDFALGTRTLRPSNGKAVRRGLGGRCY
jgi:hypothetical protein